MPHDSASAKNPQTWIRSAESDLAIARMPLPPEGMYEQLCFHAQQAAEKSIKAVLLLHGIEFPFTHNVQLLLDLLPSTVSQPDKIRDTVELNAYAVFVRYPGGFEAVSEADYEQAVSIAEAAVSWASDLVKAG